MPIHYDIYPDLDLLLYIFTGECTGRQYLDLYHSIYLNDERRHHGMKVLMDICNGGIDFDLESLKGAISIVADNKENGRPRDRVALLTRSSNINELTNTLATLADDLPLELEVFYNFQDAVRWLGLTETEKEAIEFWEAFKQEKK